MMVVCKRCGSLIRETDPEACVACEACGYTGKGSPLVLPVDEPARRKVAAIVAWANRATA